MLCRLALLLMLILLLIGCGGSQSYPVVAVDNASSVTRVAIFSGHSGGVNAVAWSPDGKMLASAGDDHTIYLWDPGGGKEIRHWSGHTLPITSLAFSPDGKTLASGGRDKAVILWDPANGQQLRTFSDSDQVLTLALSGFYYNAARGSIAFAPATSADDFRCFFSAGTGWGNFEQQRSRRALSADLTLDYGRLQLRQLGLQPAGAARTLNASLNGNSLIARLGHAGEATLVEFESQVELSAGNRLRIELTGA